MLIDGTLPDATQSNPASAAVQLTGAGVAGGFGGRLLLAGVRVIANHSAGVALSQGGETTLVGVAVEDHVVNAAGHAGVGLMFEAGQTPVQLLSVRSARNRAAAVALHAAPATLDGCVLALTQEGKLAKADSTGKPTGGFVALADGLVAGYTTGVTIARTLAIGNPRAGLLLAGSKGLSMTGVQASGGLYGVALEQTLKPALGASWVQGSVAAVASDTGLDVPAAPVVLKLAVE